MFIRKRSSLENTLRWLRRVMTVVLIVANFAAVVWVGAAPAQPDTQPSFPIRAAFYYPWFPEAWNQQGFNPFTNYKPSLNFYDGGSQSVIKQHITAMQYGGIQVGIASWWGQGSRTDGRIPALLQAAGGTPFRWSVYYENESLGDPSSAQITSDLTYLRDHYGNDPSFLRINGRFVVFVYAAGSDACGMADRWKQGNTVGAYVVLKVFSGFDKCASQPDGWHQYSPAVAADSQQGRSYAISPGFWKKGDIVRLARDLNRWNKNIKDMIASRAPFQLITTFNEWGEGTAVESAQEWASSSGYGAYLDALHDNGQSAAVPVTAAPTNTLLPAVTKTSLPAPTLAAAPSTTLQLRATMDASVRSSVPNTNYGKSKTLIIDGSPVIRTYLRFDVQGLSGPAAKVTLRVYATSSSKAGYKVYEVPNTTWQEKQITFNNAPALGRSIGTTGAVRSGTWTKLDISSLVKGNGTFSLALEATSATAISFTSREGGGKGPQLAIVTSSAGPVATATSAPKSTTVPTGMPTSTQEAASPTSAPTQALPATSTPTQVQAPDATLTPTPLGPAASPTTMPAQDATATAIPSATPTLVQAASPTPTAVPTNTNTATPLPTQTRAATPTLPATAVPPNTSGIQHVFVVVMENHSYNQVWNTSSSPYITSLGNQFGRATNYHATTHPSLPNYLDLFGGSHYTITNDCSPSSSCHINATNLADTLEAKGLTWKGYMESMPAPCGVSGSGKYAPKHNPMVYFDDIRNNATRCNTHDVPITALATDLASRSTTPNYAMIVPNLCNDMHDCSVSTGDTWLKNTLPSILNSPACTVDKCLLILTWDEDDSSQSNQVLTIFAGSAARTGGVTTSVSYNHFSLLRTVESIFGLPTLTSKDAAASPMNDLLR